MQTPLTTRTHLLELAHKVQGVMQEHESRMRYNEFQEMRAELRYLSEMLGAGKYNRAGEEEG